MNSPHPQNLRLEPVEAAANDVCWEEAMSFLNGDEPVELDVSHWNMVKIMKMIYCFYLFLPYFTR